MSQQRRQRQNSESENQDGDENLTSKNSVDKKYLSIPVDEIKAEADKDTSPSK